MTVLVEIQGLRKHYSVRGGLMQTRAGAVRALDGVDLSIREGECLAVVGESGSGKSTLGRCALALIEATEGEVLFDGENLLALTSSALRKKRRDFQMIFQDPIGSLNPRQTVGNTLAEPLEIHDVVPGSERRNRVLELLQMVGVPESAEGAYPHELSGGQRQRVAIARALASQPRFLVADEPVSALDVSLRGQILNLLIELRERLQITVLFIAHDLAVVAQISDRVAVMYSGKIVELASTERVFGAPQHPYTVSLLSAARGADAHSGAPRIVLSGEPPNPAVLPTGCRFHPRCPIGHERCRREEPALIDVAPGHAVSCHFPGELVG